LPFNSLLNFWERAQGGGKMSFRLEELDQSNEILCKNNLYIHYLENLAKDIEGRDCNSFTE
jgi:recombination protein U